MRSYHILYVLLLVCTYIQIYMHLVMYTSNISSTSVKTIQLKISATNSAKASQENGNTVKMKASFDI